MSTYVLMRILESAPHRYDLGMRLLTLGRREQAYDRVASLIERGHRVLDIGCGTGALTLRAARRGAIVKGIDVNPEMLAMARARVREEHLEATVELVEQGVAELDAEKADAYDTVVSGLCFSELSRDELTYTLRQVVRILKPGGRLGVADEILPEHRLARAGHALLRVPLAALTWAITQQTSHALEGLPECLDAAGLPLVSMTRSALGSFGVFVAKRPVGAPP